MNENRSNLYLLTGLVLGLVLGLLVAWVISPVKYVDTAPSSLSAAQKDSYRQVIALAYRSSRDLGRARMRIDLVDPGSSYQLLAAQAQRKLAENNSPDEARALAQLAADLSQSAVIGSTPAAQAQPAETATGAPAASETAAAAVSADTPATPQEVAAIQTATPTPLPPTPTASATPAPTFTPRPTSTPARVLEAPFILKNRQKICDASVSPNVLQVFVTGSDGEPLPGIQIKIVSKNGEESFYTGLIPEVGMGYADFLMEKDFVYKIEVGNVSSSVDDIVSDGVCGFRFEFTQNSE